MINKIRVLNGNTLKIIAMIAMLIDHIGYRFNPSSIVVFRGIGRLAFPIFAFMIAEGCRYTKNKKLHFGLIFSLATLCQVVYYFADDHDLYMSVLVTFSLAILAIYALDYAKSSLFNEGIKVIEKVVSVLLFGSIIVALVLLTNVLRIDYGLYGILTPVFISITYFNNTNIKDKKIIKLIDNNITRVLILAICIFILTQTSDFHCKGINMTYFMFASIPLLLLYNGQKGKYNLKYMFYIFYPVHLVAIEGVYRLLH